MRQVDEQLRFIAAVVDHARHFERAEVGAQGPGEVAHAMGKDGAHVGGGDATALGAAAQAGIGGEQVAMDEQFVEHGALWARGLVGGGHLQCAAGPQQGVLCRQQLRPAVAPFKNEGCGNP